MQPLLPFVAWAAIAQTPLGRTALAQEPAAPALAEPGPRTFVEEVRVLHVLAGEQAGDQFGWEERNCGDADGDGVDDFIVSAPYRAIGGQNSGRVYVYSGKSGAEHFRHDGAPDEFLGIGISGYGDVDGDGHAEPLGQSSRVPRLRRAAARGWGDP